MHSPRIKDFSVLEVVASTELFFEKRMFYDGSNNLIYIGYSQIPNELSSNDTWYIVKLEYTGTSLVRYRLPNGGAKFAYVLDNRANFFP